MSILSAADKELYFPQVDLEENLLYAALGTAQMIVEGFQGANRKLEISQITQSPSIDGDGIVLLSHLPVIPASETRPITVKIRGRSSISPFKLSADSSKFVELVESRDYEIDHARGELRLSSQHAAGFVSRGVRGGSRRSPSSPISSAQLRIEYWSGFDFSDDADPDVVAIKRATAQVLQWTLSQAYAGIESIQVDRRVAVRFQGGSQAIAPGSVPGPMLQIFKRYEPRSLP